jgi:alkanesulfonate monooxygenase SsuD/methylene tetrahydromethanopterin reductase-like flavin-dependent oxidoreductase (luciferase family)
VQICRAMLRSERPTMTGKHYRVHDARNVPAPVQPDGIPIMIGGSGEKRTLKLVAQYADMCNVSGGPATLAHKLDVLRGHCDTVGRDPKEITTTRLGTLVLLPDVDEAARTRDFLSTAAGDAFGEQFTVGTADEVLAEVAALTATGIDTLIFNMPLSDPDAVVRTGELLTSRFA